MSMRSIFPWKTHVTHACGDDHRRVKMVGSKGMLGGNGQHGVVSILLERRADGGQYHLALNHPRRLMPEAIVAA